MSRTPPPSQARTAPKPERRGLFGRRKPTCQFCGSTRTKIKYRTPGYGYTLFALGILLAMFTCGVSLILTLISLCVSEKYLFCRDCRMASR